MTLVFLFTFAIGQMWATVIDLTPSSNVSIENKKWKEVGGGYVSRNGSNTTVYTNGLTTGGGNTYVVFDVAASSTITAKFINISTSGYTDKKVSCGKVSSTQWTAITQACTGNTQYQLSIASGDKLTDQTITLPKSQKDATTSCSFTASTAGKYSVFWASSINDNVRLYEIEITASGGGNVAPSISAPTADSEKAYLLNATADEMSVTATGTPTPSFQWYYKASKTATDSTEVTGANTAKYTPSTTSAYDRYYYCKVSNSVGTKISKFFRVQVLSEAIAPTITFNDGAYTAGGSALNLSSLFSSNSSGAVTYSVKTDGGTSATIDGTSFTASASGTCVVTATQAANGVYAEATEDANVVVTAIVLTAHTPGTYEKLAASGGYGIDLTTVDGSKYEVYYFSANGKYGTTTTGAEKATYRLMAADSDSEHILFADASAGTSDPIGWMHYCDWIKTDFATSGFKKSDYEYGTDKYGEFFEITPNGGNSDYTKTCKIGFKAGDSFTLKVSGYVEFALLGKDNGGSKYLTVSVDGGENVLSKSTTLGRRAVELTTGEHTIVVSAISSSSSDIYGFSLKLPKTYTVTFNNNGHGGDAPEEQSGIAEGGKATAPANPSDASYDFGGWYNKANWQAADAEKWNFSTSTVTKDTILYAKWTAKAATQSAINYTNTKSATPVSTLPTTYYEGTGIASFPALNDVEDFHFIGWSPASISDEATGAQSIAATWVDAYDVTFDANGGGTAPDAFQKWYGAKFNLPGQGSMTAPSGKVFDGWKAGGTKYAENAEYTMGNAAVEFVAQWKAVPQTIYYWQSSYSGNPTMNSAVNVTGGTIEWKTDDNNKSWAYESYDKGSNVVPADLQVASGKKAVKTGGNALYAELTLSGGVKFKEGDTIYVGGYNPWMFSTSKQRYEGTTPSEDATKPMSGDIAIVETGSSNSSYSYGYAIIPEDIDVAKMYMIRGKGNTSSIAAIKVVRPAGVKPTVTFSSNKSEMYTNETATLTFTSQNQSSVVYVVKKNDAVTTDASITGTTFAATEAGTYVIYATQAFDGEYRAVEKSVTITVTAATPVTEVTVAGAEAVYTNNEVVFTATAENATDYEWYVGETKQGSDSAKLHFTPSEAGTYYIVCKARNQFNETGVWIASDAHELEATKLCGELVKIVLTAKDNGTVSGTVSGTKDVNASTETKSYDDKTGYKLNGKNQYVGIKELAYPLRAADTVIVYVTETSAKLQLFSDKGSTLIGEMTSGVAKGENKIILNKAATGKSAIYLYRTEAAGGAMNPYVYSLTVKRPCEKSNDANISLLTINGDTVAPVSKVYNYEVPFTIDLSKVTVAYETHPWATSSQESSFDINVPAVGDPANTQNIVVTAEDGTTQESYTVNVAKAAAAHTDASLKSLSVTGYTLDPEFAAETTTYWISRAFNVQNPAKSAIKATANDKYAKSVVIDSLGTSYTVTVTAEDNTTKQVYTINVNVTEAEKSLSKVEFGNGFNAFIDNTNRTVKAYYMAGTDAPAATTITADKGTAGELSEGKIRVTGSDESFVDYIVTLEAVDPMTSYDKQTFDGSENYVKAGLDYDGCWKFRRNATSDDREQRGYTRMYFFVGGGADKATFTSAQSKRDVKIYVNNVLTDVDETASSGSTFDVPLNPNAANNMIAIISNQTSGDGGVSAVKLNEHVISSDASLKSLTVNSKAIDLASGELVAGVMTYKYELPYGTTAVPVVAAEANDAFATMGVITQAASVTGTATFSVTAEDNTEQEYAVQFSVARFPTIVIWDGSTMGAVKESPDASGLAWEKTSSIGVSSFSAKTCEENGKSYTKALDFGGKTTTTRQFSITVPDGYVAKVSLVYRAKGTGRSIMISSALSDVVNDKTISSVEAVDNENLYAFTSLFNGGTLYINTTDGFYVHEISVQLAPGYSRSAMLGNGVLGTVCVPNNVAIEDIEGVTVYELMGRDYTNYGKLAFDEIVSGELEAGVPYLFQANGDHMSMLYGETHVNNPVNKGNGMYGTFEQTVLSGDQLDGVYYFAQKALWSCEGALDLTIGANRAYVKLSEIPELNANQMNPAPGRRRVTMAVNGEKVATGMENVQGDDVQSTKMLINGQLFILRGEKMYDATGRLVK